MLAGPQWPRLYPAALASEVGARASGSGEVGRAAPGFLRLASNLAASLGEMGSWVKVQPV